MQLKKTQQKNELENLRNSIFPKRLWYQTYVSHTPFKSTELNISFLLLPNFANFVKSLIFLNLILTSLLNSILSKFFSPSKQHFNLTGNGKKEEQEN